MFSISNIPNMSHNLKYWLEFVLKLGISTFVQTAFLINIFYVYLLFNSSILNNITPVSMRFSQISMVNK